MLVDHMSRLRVAHYDGGIDRGRRLCCSACLCLYRGLGLLASLCLSWTADTLTLLVQEKVVD